jgi:hypothetical protein
VQERVWQWHRHSSWHNSTLPTGCSSR